MLRVWCALMHDAHHTLHEEKLLGIDTRDTRAYMVPSEYGWPLGITEKGQKAHGLKGCLPVPSETSKGMTGSAGKAPADPDLKGSTWPACREVSKRLLRLRMTTGST